MQTGSISSSESFAARAQRSEARRVVLWTVVLLGMLAITLARRWFGGVSMRDGSLFFPYAGVLVSAVLCQLALYALLRRANRLGVLLPGWLWRANAAFDLSVAAVLLVIVSFLSPRGAVPALSGPALLLTPIVLMLSVMRLRPNFTLHAGLAAAFVHLSLAARAIAVTGAPPETYPVYFAYGGILALTALSGWFVAREVRAHVREAADEAAAHERAERQVFGMQSDLRVAREIQLGLLPAHPPTLAGFDITGMNRPADQTGGDYYDWQALPDGRLAVVLADVSGHGIGPALVMAVCRAYARSTAPTAPDPAALLGRLNELLLGDLPADRFITFAVAVLDEDGGARLVSAGHGPTLLYRAATRDVEQFEGDGLPLGVSAGEVYGPTNVLAMNEGDVLVMLTDGYFEWCRPGDGEPFGIPRLTETLRAAAGADAGAILRTLDETVQRFCDGSPQSDDMTAIVIKRTAPVAGHAPAAPAVIEPRLQAVT
ncbi:MAG TPA: PP2C family protein-serine/threonine phosphatase [Tepidisphaeraceae bacterium]|nr:PP2C family protein-serine/threonine phosphatase [Tepidisphaeraceae bacterium]